MLLLKNEKQQAREEEIDDEDENGRDNHGCRRRSAHALRPPADIEPFKAADGRDDDSEHDRFNHPLNQVAEFERVYRAGPKLHRTQMQREIGDDESANQADKIGWNRKFVLRRVNGDLYRRLSGSNTS